MNNIDLVQKISILHCVFQTIASADGAWDEVRDEEVLEFVLGKLGLNSYSYWDKALQMNVYDCFVHLAALDTLHKQLFAELLMSVAQMGGNTVFRVNCAKHILQLSNC